MNDLIEIWQHDSGNGESISQILQKKSFQRADKKGPLEKLKQNLAIHIGYAVVITLGYAFLIYYFPYWQVQACLLLLIVFNFWAMAKAMELYNAIKPDAMQANVLTELKAHHRAFSGWQKQNLRVALFVYPFAAAGGFMLGGSIGSGLMVDQWMNNAKIWIALLVVVIILVPLSYWLAKWMTRVAFGKYIDQLKKRIEELESQE